MKHIPTMIIALSLILISTACGRSETPNEDIPGESETLTQETANDASYLPDSLQNLMVASQEDLIRRDITIGFLDRESEDTLHFTLDLPDYWTVSSGVVCDLFNRNNPVGVIQMSPKAADAEPPFSVIEPIYDGEIASKEMMVSNYPAKSYTVVPRVQGGIRMAAQYLYYIELEDAYVIFYFDSEEKGDAIQAGFDKIVSSFQLTAPPAIEIKMDTWFAIKDYMLLIYVPSNWDNNITIKQMEHSTDDVITYGFLLSPKDIPVEEQYVGALRIYDETYWNRLGDSTKNEEIILSSANGKVYTYRNSQFNQYPDSPQAKLFDELVLADEDVTRLLHIKLTQ